MKTLILMRHAKAGSADPGMGDHDRSLNKRGRSAAPVMAHWLAARGLRPGRVLCSPSRRTRETAALMRNALPWLPEPEFPAALYHAGPGTLLEHLIPTCTDQNPLAHSRMAIEMIFHGRSMSLFQASQQSATISS